METAVQWLRDNRLLRGESRHGLRHAAARLGRRLLTLASCDAISCHTPATNAMHLMPNRFALLT